MKVTDLESLNKVFKNKVIPQLQEFFYSDWQKIQWVLGEQFITSENQSGKIKMAVESSDFDHEVVIYKVSDDNSWNEDSFTSIYL